MVSVTAEAEPEVLNLPSIEPRITRVLDRPEETQLPLPHDVILAGIRESHEVGPEFSDTPSFVGNPRPGYLVPRNHAALSQRINRLLPVLWSIVLSKGLQTGLLPTSAIDVETDREEGTSRPVLRVYLKARAAQALAFWEGLDADLERWLERLDKLDRQAVQREFGLRIHWLES